MLVTAHVLAGALIGRAVGRPAVAFPATVASHLAMDVVPHWGHPDERVFLRVARVDGLTGLLAIALALALTPARRRGAVSAGVAGGVLLDLDKPGRHFLGWSPFPRAVDDFHARIQEGREAPGRWPVDVLTALALASMVWGAPRR